jgi:hypothetical protein
MHRTLPVFSVGCERPGLLSAAHWPRGGNSAFLIRRRWHAIPTLEGDGKLTLLPTFHT